MVGLVNFSESTRFTQEKYEQSQLWCRETDRRQPQHLLYPRTKGFITTVQQLRQAPHVKAVYDLTIAYHNKQDSAGALGEGGGGSDAFQKPPSIWTTLSTAGLSDRWGYRFHVHVRRFPIESLPEKDEDLATWLEERWIEKGVWLEAKRQSWLSEEVD